MKKFAKILCVAIIASLIAVPTIMTTQVQAHPAIVLAGIAAGAAAGAAGGGLQIAENDAFQPEVYKYKADPATVIQAPAFVLVDVISVPTWAALNIFSFGVRIVSFNQERPAVKGPKFMWYK